MARPNLAAGPCMGTLTKARHNRDKRLGHRGAGFMVCECCLLPTFHDQISYCYEISVTSDLFVSHTPLNPRVPPRRFGLRFCGVRRARRDKVLERSR